MTRDAAREAEERTVCAYCGVYDEEHDHQHLARYCYPKRIDALLAEIAALRRALEGYAAAIDWVAGDSFDMCSECRSKLDHAQSAGRLALSRPTPSAGGANG